MCQPFKTVHKDYKILDISPTQNLSRLFVFTYQIQSKPLGLTFQGSPQARPISLHLMQSTLSPSKHPSYFTLISLILPFLFPPLYSISRLIIWHHLCIRYVLVSTRAYIRTKFLGGGNIAEDFIYQSTQYTKYDTC